MKRVIVVFGSAKPRAGKDAEHDVILNALTSESKTPLIARVEDLVQMYAKNDVGSEEYWTAAIEAFFVARYDEAHLILNALWDELHERRFESHNALFPLVLIGTIRAGMWGRCYSSVKNEVFQEMLPMMLGKFLVDYADGSNSAHARHDGISSWALGNFSSAFAGYLSKENDPLRRHLCGLIETLGEIGTVGQGSRKLMEEVVHRIMRQISLVHQVRMIAGHLDKNSKPRMTVPQQSAAAAS